MYVLKFDYKEFREIQKITSKIAPMYCPTYRSKSDDVIDMIITYKANNKNKISLYVDKDELTVFDWIILSCGCSLSLQNKYLHELKVLHKTKKVRDKLKKRKIE